MYRNKLSPHKEEKDKVWDKVAGGIDPKGKTAFSLLKWRPLFLVILLLGTIGLGISLSFPKSITEPAKVDDWEYSYVEGEFETQETLNGIAESGPFGYMVFGAFLVVAAANLILGVRFIVYLVQKHLQKKEYGIIFSNSISRILGILALLNLLLSILIVSGNLSIAIGGIILLCSLGLITFLGGLYLLVSILKAFISKLKRQKTLYFWKKLRLGMTALLQGGFVPLIPVLLVFSILGGSTVYDSAVYTGSGGGSPIIPSPTSISGNMPNIAFEKQGASDEMGYSVGGAKDINNFRENIENDYLPIPTDITYEGLFYDYYFDTGKTQECTKLFCPSYSYALSKDPISMKTDYYLSVGLNSGIKESDFQRKKLNLVVVLDISGSMSSPFYSYYYDQYGNKVETEQDADRDKSKMQVANESIVALLDHLNEDDRFGMVMFDENAYLGKKLTYTKETDMEAIKKHILDLTPRGSTNMEAGMEKGTELFDRFLDADQTEYENRIIFLTDAMPNTGDTSETGFLGMTRTNAQNKIYTTFIGIGVDFNTELIESITKVRGANYYSVHSSKEFKERMDEGFEYMVTPLVFNLELRLDAEGFDIEKVYGSPEANEATGEILKVNTLFPSKTVDGETKGGVIILKLKKTSDEYSLTLKSSYEDREGNTDGDEQSIVFGKEKADYYQNSGIQKAILLSRYADLMKNWVIDERIGLQNDEEVQNYVNDERGLAIPQEVELGQWERQSSPLQVSSVYRKLIQEFKLYFENEMNVLGDEALKQEVEVMEKLTK
ncbi:MAG: VWA domain-containing protein [Candidatus Dojkabacteria bacterium]|nr:VWA domain-containing protein [Candidatus Dojkabacteria bacterium]